jgi:hypothetical protein
MTKPLSKKDIDTPRNLPARADPASEEARIFGPFSKRREVNIRRRFFRTETKKLLPPLAVQVMESRTTNKENILLDFDIRKTNLFHEAEKAVGDLYRGPTKTRRECKVDLFGNQSQTDAFDRHPSRWIRRRYRWLLSRLPCLVYKGTGGNKIGVQISSRSFCPYQRTPAYMSEADSTTIAWIQRPAVVKCDSHSQVIEISNDDR